MVKPGGQIGIVVPGLTKELLESPPKHLEPYWEWEFCSFHSPGWWRAHWEKSGQVEVILADLLPRGHEHWLTWNELWIEHGNGPNEGAVREAEMLRADAGQYLGFARVVARRK